MFNRTKAVLGGIFLVVLAAGLATIAHNRSWAYSFFAADFVFACVVLILTAASERRYRQTRDTLGELLSKSEELMYRRVVDEAQYATWRDDLNSWFDHTCRFLTQELSSTHEMMFRDLSEGGRYNTRDSFNSEHAELLNSLGKYTRNLRTITDRYLTTRS